MRIITLLVSLVTALVVIALLTKILPPEAAAILLDIKRSSWPFTVQNILWVVFFIGLGELSIRWRAGRLEESQNAVCWVSTSAIRPIRPIHCSIPASSCTCTRSICVTT